MRETACSMYWRRVFLVFAPLMTPEVATMPAPAQSTESSDTTVLDALGALGKEADGLDWDQESARLQRALRNIWAQNGWNNESDRYAHELAREIMAIPPWKFNERLDLFTDRLAGRYDMSKDDTIRFRGMILREVTGVMFRHAGPLFKQAREALGARVRGEPYTAEQVARWTEANAPLRAEARLVAERLFKQLDTMLKPQGRRILQRDAESYRKRVKRFDEMATRWVKGEWQPSDWGLQHDPIQMGALRGVDGQPRPPTNLPGAARNEQDVKLPKWKAHDPTTWLAYVLDFKNRFKLDASQATAVESIHAEILARANDYVRAHDQKLREVATTERATHEAYEPVRALFQEMQDRFDAVPTSAQRDRGQP